MSYFQVITTCYPTNTEDPSPRRCSGDNQSVGSSVLVVNRWLWCWNRTLLEEASMVVTRCIVAFFHSDSTTSVWEFYSVETYIEENFPIFWVKQTRNKDSNRKLFFSVPEISKTVDMYMFLFDDILLLTRVKKPPRKVGICCLCRYV